MSLKDFPPYQSLFRAVEHETFCHYVLGTTGDIVGSVVKQDVGWKVFPSGHETYFPAENKFDAFLILQEHYKQVNGLY